MSDPSPRIAARLWRRAGLAAALSAGGLAGVRVIVDGPSGPVGIILAVAALAFTAVASAGARGPGPAGVPTVAGITLVSMAFVDGGLGSEALYWAGFVPLVAALLCGGRAAVAAGLAVAGAVALLFIAQAAHVLPHLPSRDVEWLSLHAAAAATAAVFGGALGWLYDRYRLEDRAALTEARGDERALLDALPDAVLRLDSPSELGDLRLPSRSQLTPPLVGALLREDAVRAELEAVFAQRLPRTFEHRFSHGSDELFVELRAVPIADGGVVGIARDISERRRLERLTTDFVASVSHELRTPLTSIYGALKLIGSLDGPASGDEQCRDLLDVAERNAERLRASVEQLLDMRGLMAGLFRLHPEDLWLPEQVDRAVGRVQEWSDEAGVELRVRAVEPCSVSFDALRLQQVLFGVLSNAVKFSPEGTVVDIGAHREGDRAIVEVHDSGPGIPDEERELVFAPFSRGEVALEGAHRGTGLGLALARELLQRSGGDIDFEPGDSVGTVFRVGLPVAAEACATPVV